MFDKEMVHESFESNLLAEEVGGRVKQSPPREREREEAVRVAVQNMKSTPLLTSKRLQTCTLIA